MLGERVAVSLGGGQAVDGQRVGGAVAGEDDGRVERAAGYDGQYAVSFTDSRRFDLRQATDSLDPPIASHHHVGVLADDVRLGIELDDFIGRAQRGLPLVGELCCQLLEFFLDDAPELLRRAEQRLDPVRIGTLLLQLLTDLVDLEPADPVEHHFENRVGLDLIEREGLEQFLGGVGFSAARADQLQGLVESIEEDLETLENVDAFSELFELEFEASPHGVEAKRVEVVEHFAESESAWHQRIALVGHECGGVVGDVLFQRGVFEQVGHHRIGIGFGLDLQHDLQPRFARGLIDEIGQLGQLAVGDQQSDIGLQRVGGDAVGDRVNHDPPGRVASATRFEPPFASDLDRTLAGGVGVPQ